MGVGSFEPVWINFLFSSWLGIVVVHEAVILTLRGFLQILLNMVKCALQIDFFHSDNKMLSTVTHVCTQRQRSS